VEQTRDLTGVILAGGTGRRFGSDKAWAMLDGRTLLDRVAEAVALACPRVFVVTAAARELPPSSVPFQRVDDVYPGEGPLGGMASAFRLIGAGGTGGAFVTAVDAPFIDYRDIARVAGFLAPGVDVAVPRAGGSLQPLFAVYSVAGCLPAIERLFAAGERRVQTIFEHLRVAEVDSSLLNPLSFRSVNTANDLRGAEQLARDARTGSAPKPRG
jgi:molybdopterin-guanine dinucleotide biosynthesis protein A